MKRQRRLGIAAPPAGMISLPEWARKNGVTPSLAHNWLHNGYIPSSEYKKIGTRYYLNIGAQPDGFRPGMRKVFCG